ncbi:MAG: DivIVA domain-containing protein [Acidimicrobiales bacterium]
MAMSPEDVRNQTFSVRKRGYDRGEVHRFLDGVAEELHAFSEAAVGAAAQVAAQPVAAEAKLDDLVIEAEPVSAEPAITTAPTTSVDEFDRVGSEISLMLRQAQESALKIRNDAEVEARTLVDQVRLDLEADRSAHEQAAADLIGRTEERASEIRSEADTYGEETRGSADDYAARVREDSDRARSEADEAVAAAQTQAETIVGDARTAATDEAEHILSDARSTLTNFVHAERASRENLENARSLIDSALSQISVTDIEVGEPTDGVSNADTDD